MDKSCSGLMIMSLRTVRKMRFFQLYRCIGISKHFVERSLAQRDAASGGIRLHDLQLDYVRAGYSDREALALIHGALRLSCPRDYPGSDAICFPNHRSGVSIF
jgi:hypothetical protein